MKEIGFKKHETGHEEKFNTWFEKSLDNPGGSTSEWNITAHFFKNKLVDVYIEVDAEANYESVSSSFPLSFKYIYQVVMLIKSMEGSLWMDFPAREAEPK